MTGRTIEVANYNVLCVAMGLARITVAEKYSFRRLRSLLLLVGLLARQWE